MKHTAMRSEESSLLLGDVYNNAMTGDEILPQVASILSDITGRAPDTITRDSHLRNDLTITSLDLIESAVRIEQMSGVRMEDSIVSEFTTVGQLVDYLEQESHSSPRMNASK